MAPLWCRRLPGKLAADREQIGGWRTDGVERWGGGVKLTPPFACSGLASVDPDASPSPSGIGEICRGDAVATQSECESKTRALPQG